MNAADGIMDVQIIIMEWIAERNHANKNKLMHCRTWWAILGTGLENSFLLRFQNEFLFWSFAIERTIRGSHMLRLRIVFNVIFSNDDRGISQSYLKFQRIRRIESKGLHKRMIDCSIYWLQQIFFQDTSETVVQRWCTLHVHMIISVVKLILETNTSTFLFHIDVLLQRKIESILEIRSRYYRYAVACNDLCIWSLCFCVVQV